MLYSTMSDAGAKTTVKKIGQSPEAPAGFVNQNLVVFEVIVVLLCRLICFFVIIVMVVIAVVFYEIFQSSHTLRGRCQYQLTGASQGLVLPERFSELANKFIFK